MELMTLLEKNDQVIGSKDLIHYCTTFTMAQIIII